MPRSRRIPAINRDAMIANWLLTELLGALNADGKTIEETPMPPERLSALLRLVEDGTISGKIGKEIFEESYKTGEEPAGDRRAPRRAADQRRSGALGGRSTRS